jgi:hypothetical protein
MQIGQRHLDELSSVTDIMLVGLAFLIFALAVGDEQYRKKPSPPRASGDTLLELIDRFKIMIAEE